RAFFIDETYNYADTFLRVLNPLLQDALNFIIGGLCSRRQRQGGEANESNQQQRERFGGSIHHFSSKLSSSLYYAKEFRESGHSCGLIFNCASQTSRSDP